MAMASEVICWEGPDLSWEPQQLMYMYFEYFLHQPDLTHMIKSYTP